MKKLITFLFLLFQAIFQFAQPPCSSDTPISAFDESPGCYLNTFPFETNNFDATAESTPFNFPCGTIENSMWFSMLADPNGEINLLLDGESCLDNEGFEAGLYDMNLNRVGGCSSIIGINSCLQINYHSLTPGEVYQLMVDGYEGAQCKFTIRKRVDIQSDFNITLNGKRIDTQICPLAEVCFSVDKIENVKEYIWTVNRTPQNVTGGGITDSFFCFRTGGIGIYEVRVRINFDCSQTKIATYFERVSNSVITQDDTIRFCQDTTYIVDGQELTKPGFYFFEYENATAFNCDSTYRLVLTKVDTTAPKIRCFKDTFINRIGIEWTKNPEISRYELEINDTLIHLDNRFTYLFNPEVADSILNIRLSPYSNTCNHAVGTAECRNGRTVSTKTQVEKALVKIAPNPTYSSVKIESEIPIKKVQVFDAHGRLILNTKDSKVNLETEAAGVYFFKIETSNEIVLKKIIKI